ncbi:hypothetical protein JOB18_003138 [Solea senegalensis]|uniref:Uncharacterized protein n=1 Tax=Solea senegalensis TaxID=28829 RepID=A0AAV6T314_SOLSE|nr:hypothetical protein JOB18_003138 [Solea senegalensis]
MSTSSQDLHDTSPLDPSLFILSPLHHTHITTAGDSPHLDVCLAAAFRPREGKMYLDVSDRLLPLDTGGAVLHPRDNSFFFTGFSNENISSCGLHNTSIRRLSADDDEYPDDVKVNSFLLLMNAARLLLIKTVAFNTLLTIRALIP